MRLPIATKNFIYTLTSTTLLAALLSGCATNREQVPSMGEMLSETTGQDGRACVRQGDIRGYGVLKNRVISIDGRRNYFLATVHPGCNDLNTSIGTIFDGRFAEVCGQRMDRVVTQNEQCTIGQVYQFEDREAAFNTYEEILERREKLQN